MIRGTTPTHVFTLPLDTSDIKDLRITYAQNDKMVIEKNINDCELKDKEIKVRLTQEDTLKLSDRTVVEIQLKVITVDNTVMASPVRRISVTEVLNEEVLA